MKDVYKRMNIEIAEHYGYTNQSCMLIEECAELIQAINKLKREDYRALSRETIADRICHITEEIADVEVMLEQVKHLLNIPEEDVERIRRQKITRQQIRMNSNATN